VTERCWCCVTSRVGGASGHSDVDNVVARLAAQRGSDSGHVRSLKTRSLSLLEVIRLHVVESLVVLTASQVIEWMARARRSIRSGSAFGHAFGASGHVLD
jgi:hypothetical protein